MTSRLPPKPEKPLDSDCCGQGCTPCVLDLYGEDLKRWEAEVKNGSRPPTSKTFSSSEGYFACTLQGSERLTADTSLYRFSMPPGVAMRAGPGQHAVARVAVPGQGASPSSISRQYTILEHDGDGFAVAVKCYPQGRMSKVVEKWEVGSAVDWRGPFGDLKLDPRRYGKCIVLAMGTGVAPFFSLLSDWLSDADSECLFRIYLGFRTMGDVLLKERWKALADYWNVKIILFLSGEAEDGPRCRFADVRLGGRLQAGKIAREEGTSNGNMFLVCGSKSFEKEVVKSLSEAGVSDGNIHRF